MNAQQLSFPPCVTEFQWAEPRLVCEEVWRSVKRSCSHFFLHFLHQHSPSMIWSLSLNPDILLVSQVTFVTFGFWYNNYPHNNDFHGVIAWRGRHHQPVSVFFLKSEIILQHKSVQPAMRAIFINNVMRRSEQHTYIFQNWRRLKNKIHQNIYLLIIIFRSLC